MSKEEEIEIKNGRICCFFDDGHTPETFLNHFEEKNDCSKPQTFRSRIVKDQKKNIRNHLSVHTNVISHELADLMYKTSSTQGSWGTYVTFDEVRTSMAFKDSFREDLLNNTEPSSSTPLSVETYRHELAKLAVLEFLFERINLHKEENIHGVAVWGLSSSISNQVQYHIDYAELIRYEHNLIYPPIYAGTIQVSPIKEIIGGDFAVNTEGLRHYEKNGYKGKKSHDEYGGYYQQPVSLYDDYARENRNASSPPWITIPYKYNQGILHDGDYPHLSTPITSISPVGEKRVIIGLNIFSHDIGPIVQKAPEHSQSFNKRVKLMQFLSRCKSKNNDLSEKIRHNKALRKLFVLAKREKVKQELQREKTMVLESLIHILNSQKEAMSIGDIIELLVSSNDPNYKLRENDLLVYINQWIRYDLLEKDYNILCVSSQSETKQQSMFDENGMVLPSCKLIKVQ